MIRAFGLILAAVLAIAPLQSLAAATTAVKPSCTGRVVWIIPHLKAYVLSNNPLYGKKPGWYACETSAATHGYRMRPLNIMRPMTVHAKASGASAASSPKPSPSAAPAAVPENPALTTLARAQIDLFRAGKIDRTQYGAQLNAVLTDTLVKQWSQVLAISGAVTSFAYAGTANVSGLPVAQYAVTFEHPITAPGYQTTNQWIESIATDQNGKVVYLSFAPKKP